MIVVDDDGVAVRDGRHPHALIHQGDEALLVPGGILQPDGAAAEVVLEGVDGLQLDAGDGLDEVPDHGARHVAADAADLDVGHAARDAADVDALAAHAVLARVVVQVEAGARMRVGDVDGVVGQPADVAEHGRVGRGAVLGDGALVAALAVVETRVFRGVVGDLAEGVGHVPVLAAPGEGAPAGGGDLGEHVRVGAEDGVDGEFGHEAREVFVALAARIFVITTTEELIWRNTLLVCC